MRVSRPGWTLALALLACGRLGAAEPAEGCAERWSLREISLGSTIATARATLDAAGGKLRPPRADDTPRMVWDFPGAERFQLDPDAAGDAAGMLTRLLAKPQGKFRDILEGYKSRWGEPDVDRYVVGADRADRLTEASVWIDLECEVKATLLGINVRTSFGLDLRRLAVRLERTVDPIGHLPELRDHALGSKGR